MPWRECSKMDERLRFVARLLDGEKMAELCREFDISRKTGYKIFTRYKDIGLEGLTDRSRRPYRRANRLPFQVETLIVALKREHPSWGAPKIREKLRRRQPDLKPPAISTAASHRLLWSAFMRLRVRFHSVRHSTYRAIGARRSTCLASPLTGNAKLMKFF